MIRRPNPTLDLENDEGNVLIFEQDSCLNKITSNVGNENIFYIIRVNYRVRQFVKPGFDRYVYSKHKSISEAGLQ